MVYTNTRKQRNYGDAHLLLVYQSPATCMAKHCNFFIDNVQLAYSHLDQPPSQIAISISASVAAGNPVGLRWWQTCDILAGRHPTRAWSLQCQPIGLDLATSSLALIAAEALRMVLAAPGRQKAEVKRFISAYPPAQHAKVH